MNLLQRLKLFFREVKYLFKEIVLHPNRESASDGMRKERLKLLKCEVIADASLSTTKDGVKAEIVNNSLGSLTRYPDCTKKLTTAAPVKQLSEIEQVYKKISKLIEGKKEFEVFFLVERNYEMRNLLAQCFKARTGVDLLIRAGTDSRLHGELNRYYQHMSFEGGSFNSYVLADTPCNLGESNNNQHNQLAQWHEDKNRCRHPTLMRDKD